MRCRVSFNAFVVSRVDSCNAALHGASGYVIWYVVCVFVSTKYGFLVSNGRHITPTVRDMLHWPPVVPHPLGLPNRYDDVQLPPQHVSCWYTWWLPSSRSICWSACQAPFCKSRWFNRAQDQYEAIRTSEFLQSSSLPRPSGTNSRHTSALKTLLVNNSHWSFYLFARVWKHPKNNLGDADKLLLLLSRPT